MRLASWNVNSINARRERVTSWIDANKPDVLCLQELKTTTDAFPTDDLEKLGYDVAAHGQGRWNGVAILSRIGLTNVQRDLPNQPTFDGVTEARAIAATCGPVRIWSLYVPNGRDVGHPHYSYKLDFLAALANASDATEAPFALAGDFNICPTDSDIWDRDEWQGTTHLTDAERDALAAVTGTGLTDVYPRALKYDQPFTYWDYRNLDFPKNRGMRIDLLLANEALNSSVTDAWVDRNQRKGKGASDHAPLVIDCDPTQ